MHSSVQPPKQNIPQATNSYSVSNNRKYGSAPAADPRDHAASGLKPDPFAGPPAPSWLQFFTMGSNARFTRTPDYLLRTDSGTVAEPQPIPVVTEAAAWVDRPAEPSASAQLRPYIAPPAAARPPEPVQPPEPVYETAHEADGDVAETESPSDEWSADDRAEEEEEVYAPAEIDWDAAASEYADDVPGENDAEPSVEAAPAHLRALAEMIQVGRALHPEKAEPQDNQLIGPHRADAATPTSPAPAEAAAPFAPNLLPQATRGSVVSPSISVNVSFAWPSLLPAAEDAPVEAEIAEDETPAEEDLAADPPSAETIESEDEATASEAFAELPPDVPGVFELPPLALLKEPSAVEPNIEHSAEYLDKNSMTLQQTLHDFGIRGEIIDANPGPVVTLYELEPAPGTKSSRVIGLADDIARSMSAISARVAVVPGRNVIGIELPNQRRETVWLRELLSSRDFEMAQMKLGLCLGKTIGGEPVLVDLARMPHLLVAGTTGSGKSVSVNAMILSLLYRHTPEACRMIMIDPKMLELSIYEGIPHLLTPVVTDPRKAVVALKWAVREMEERYKKMSRLGVRNLDGFNARANEARARGTDLVGSDGEPIEATPLPYIVVIVDEMADLMMVAGKEIEGAIQRLAQMARAAGIHLIMATQRPSVDVITGTIKANFPTRISFQVTSKIDSRTILGEQGAEQLLGQGDMLYMAGGGRLTRVHGPFVSDGEVEKVVEHLKRQGRPDYLDAVTTSEDEEEDETGAEQAEDDGAVFDKGAFGDDGADLYDQAVMIVMRDKKASTSYIQRRLQIGYNRAASIMERMENEGIVGPANHAGKREILVDSAPGFRKP